MEVFFFFFSWITDHAGFCFPEQKPGNGNNLAIKTGANAQTLILATMAPFDPAVAQERDDGASIF